MYSSNKKVGVLISDYLLRSTELLARITVYIRSYSGLRPMASVPMRVDVCRNHITKNKKLFVNTTFLLALCAWPYPLPLGNFCRMAGGSSWVMVCSAMLHCTIVPAWFAWPAWFVGCCGLFLLHNSQQHTTHDTQTGRKKFVGHVGSCGSTFQSRAAQRTFLLNIT
jgi:hypothetical protein